MKETCSRIWNKISRIGLRDGEDALLFREVILLNRIILMLFIVMLIYLPVEVAINGWQMMPATLTLFILILITWIFHHYRLFVIGHFYLYIVSNLFMIVVGLAVGKEVQNYIMLLPIVLISVIMFKTTMLRISLFLITLILYLIQQYLFRIVNPIVPIPYETREIFSIVFFVLGLLLTFIIGFYFMGINKEYEGIIVMQKENLEAKNKEITDSITYAKRIQTAILPPDSIIKKYLKENFIVYLPKDVVAGDFYWLEHVDNVILFAAADCTGHGVPGAMMSVICHNALNRSVREEGITDPGKVLDRTREIIIHELGKSNEDVKDGMDISLCALNTSTLELKWAGANNPLWYIRNNELVEIKADKQPIGQYYDQKSFTSHALQLRTNDVLYLTTDGYQDQFGGVKGKKYKASNLKNLLFENHKKPMSEQKDLVQKSFMDWKGKNEQVDDVCIIGMRISL